MAEQSGRRAAADKEKKKGGGGMLLYTEKLNRVAENMEKVIVGKKEVIGLTLTALLCGGHLLLEDVPGVGKTTLVKALAQSIQCSFSRISFTPDTLPGDVTGMTVYQMHTGEFKYIPGAVMQDIVLADEINRTSPKTQASLLEAMEESQVTVDGKTYPLSPLFMVIATQNPIEHLGTFKLPEAQLDRFLMKISMGYPEKPQEETDMVGRVLAGQQVHKLQPVVTREEIMSIKKQVEQIRVHPDVMDYAVAIARSTRNSEDIALGASPRAAIALVKAARSRAYLQGREYTIPEDIARMIRPVLLHRLTLSSKAELEGKKKKDVLEQATREVKVPRL